MPSRFLFEPPQRKSKPKIGWKSLLVRCSSTSRLTDTGRTIDEKLWPAAKMKRQKFTCAYCGKIHSWDKADVVLGRPSA